MVSSKVTGVGELHSKAIAGADMGREGEGEGGEANTAVAGQTILRVRLLPAYKCFGTVGKPVQEAQGGD